MLLYQVQTRGRYDRLKYKNPTVWKDHFEIEFYDVLSKKLASFIWLFLVCHYGRICDHNTNS